MVLLNKALGLPFSQSQVDFVIPDLERDLPLSIDPFLLYRSRDERFRRLHDHLVAIFNRGIRFFREGQRSELDRLIDFPEVNEVGLGYSAKGIQGSGLGLYLNRLLSDTLAASPALLTRGIRHIEEMQLVSLGVGPDRVSDIAANVLKSFLIEYTQEQAEIWNVPITKGLPVEHYFDFDRDEWADDYFDLPLNPLTSRPILLVPRRMVRQLPWINYNEYSREEFRSYLRANRAFQSEVAPPLKESVIKLPGKGVVVGVTRSQVQLVDQYVSRKEREAERALPSEVYDVGGQRTIVEVGESLVARLTALPEGQKTATDYQKLVYEILNYLFEPELTDGQLEVPTHLGTERRDIIYTNECERSFLKYVRDQYLGYLLMFEIKNVKSLELDHVNQASAYLGARLGLLGFIVTRNAPGENVIRKTYSIFNDTPSIPRKTVMVITDGDLTTMIRLKQEGSDPMVVLQRSYRRFKSALQ